MSLSAFDDLAPDYEVSLSCSEVTRSWEPSCPCLPLKAWLQTIGESVLFCGHPVLGTIMFLSAAEGLAPGEEVSLSSSAATLSWEQSCPCLPLRTWLQTKR